MTSTRGTHGGLNWREAAAHHPWCPCEGDAYYNTTEDVVYVYDSGNWVAMIRSPDRAEREKANAPPKTAFDNLIEGFPMRGCPLDLDEGGLR